MKIRDIVLTTLKEAASNAGGADGFVSGEELAKICGVTRMSICKAVKSLKEQGIAIESVQNRGYKYIYSDIFNEKEIKAYFINKDIQVRFYDTIDSTNTQAKRLLLQEKKEKLHKSAVIAESQTNGRGRFGRAFFSPAYSGIYFSIIYIPTEIINPGFITAATAVAICRGIKKVYGIDCLVKWTNDIIYNDVKIAGILTEGISDLETGTIDSVIIGCGINILPNKDFPIELKKKAGSIFPCSKDAKRSLFCAALIEEILSIIDNESTESRKNVMQEYKNRSILIGKRIKVYPVSTNKSDSYECTVMDIHDNAALFVRLDDGTATEIQSGEITLSGD